MSLLLNQLGKNKLRDDTQADIHLNVSEERGSGTKSNKTQKLAEPGMNDEIQSSTLCSQTYTHQLSSEQIKCVLEDPTHRQDKSKSIVRCCA